MVNLVDAAVAEAMNATSASLPYGQNELEAAGLTTAPSSVVKPPRIAEVPASLECTEWGTLQIGGNRLVIGLVKRVHVREELIDRETLRIRDERFHVIGRMASPNWYCRTQDRFEMTRAEVDFPRSLAQTAQFGFGGDPVRDSSVLTQTSRTGGA